MNSNRSRLLDIDKSLSAEIRSEMGRQRVRQSDVASKANIHRNTFGRKCRGEAPFTLGEAAQVADALGVDVTELIGRAESGAHAMAA